MLIIIVLVLTLVLYLVTREIYPMTGKWGKQGRRRWRGRGAGRGVGGGRKAGAGERAGGRRRWRAGGRHQQKGIFVRHARQARRAHRAPPTKSWNSSLGTAVLEVQCSMDSITLGVGFSQAIYELRGWCKTKTDCSSWNELNFGLS